MEDIPSEFDTNVTVRTLLEETGILGALFPQNRPRDGDKVVAPLNTYSTIKAATSRNLYGTEPSVYMSST